MIYSSAKFMLVFVFLEADHSLAEIIASFD